jgi:hypothetical protein
VVEVCSVASRVSKRFNGVVVNVVGLEVLDVDEGRTDRETDRAPCRDCEGGMALFQQQSTMDDFMG